MQGQRRLVAPIVRPPSGNSGTDATRQAGKGPAQVCVSFQCSHHVLYDPAGARSGMELG